MERKVISITNISSIMKSICYFFQEPGLLRKLHIEIVDKDFLTHFSCDYWDNIYTLSYYHHQIGGMNYYPLFRVRSWNNGVRCMSFYILTAPDWLAAQPIGSHVRKSLLADMDFNMEFPKKCMPVGVNKVCASDPVISWYNQIFPVLVIVSDMILTT